MTDPTNLAKSTVARPSTTKRELQDLDFDTPNEESMEFLEDEWRQFCHSIGLKGEIPDIRAILAAEDKTPKPHGRQSHWLVRPFVAVYDWLRAHP